MFRWLVVYGDGSSEEKWADTLQDTLYQLGNADLVHSVIKLGIVEKTFKQLFESKGEL